MRKKTISLIAAATAFAISCSPVSAVAAEYAVVQASTAAASSANANKKTSETVYGEKMTIDDLPEQEVLEQMYIDKLFYGDYGVSPLGEHGKNTLTDLELKIYTELREKIEAVASGSLTSTEFTLKKRMSTPSTYQKDMADILAAVRNVFHYLLEDLPESFYWFDKTVGYSSGCNPAYVGNSTTDIELTPTVIFDVSSSYSGGKTTTVTYDNGTKKTFRTDVNNDKITSAKAAVSNAQKIVDTYAGKTVEEMLKGYKDEICKLVSYNNDALAADYSSTHGIDPWQIVWVFDEDASTNVVCEGYAKAFQYLCDMSGIECYTVTGTMTGGTGAGPHMWNIVVLDRKSYLVDVTNCDDGSIGAPDKLFLKGVENTETGYKCSNVNYEYDNDTKALFDDTTLTVSTTSYEEPVAQANTKLKSLKVNDTDVDGFDAEKLNYSISLTYTEWNDDKDKAYVITAEAANSAATVTKPDSFKLTSTNSDAVSTVKKEITVTSGNEKTVYSITFTIAKCQHTAGDWKVSEQASCTVDGLKTKSCTVCEKVMEEEIIPASHDLEHTAAVPANCQSESDGNIEYWKCKDCSEYFSDADGKKKITQAATIVKPSHDLTKTDGKDATCTVDGNIEYWTCGTCSKTFSDEAGTTEVTAEDIVIAATGHKNLTKTEAKPATCTEDGNNAYWTCSNCDKTFSDEAGTTPITADEIKINKTGHDLTEHPALPQLVQHPAI